MHDIRVVTESPGPDQVFARNSLIVIVPTANPAHITGWKDLANSGIKVVTADTSVPIGQYTQTMLQKARADPTYWSNPAASNAAERAAVQTIGETLAGTDRRFLLAAGVAALTQGRPATEDDPSPFYSPESPRGGSENLALDFVGRGGHTVSLRFAPTVHGAGDHGFIATIAAIARERGVSGYPGDGTNRWAAVHRSDAARLVALGLDKAAAGTRLHAVAEEGISTRDIAAVIGRAFDLPVASIAPDDVSSHFGWIGTFFGMDLTATSDATRSLLGWTPRGPTLIEDLDAGAYTVASVGL